MYIARIRMPRMGTSVHESTVVAWRKSPGESVSKGEALLSAESDKVEFEIECPADGVLKEILVEAENTVPVGEVLALIETQAKVDEDAEAGTSGPPKDDSGWAAPIAPLPKRELRPRRPAVPPPAPARRAAERSGAFLSPRVQLLAAEHGLRLEDIRHIAGTGAGGRVTARDVERFAAARGTASAFSAAGGEDALLIAPDFRPLAEAGEPRESAEAFSRIRRRIAENLTRSVREIPQVTVFVDVDMSRIAAWRETHKEAFQRKHGVRLTYTPFFVLGFLAALRLPSNARFNATCENDVLTVRRYLNLGLAVDAPDGLLVPVLRDADGLGFAELAGRIEELAVRAREGRLSPEDMREGTLTLTNFGAARVRSGTPLLNPPEVAIVGTGALLPRVVPLGGDATGIRPIMELALTFDHRANDGMAAARFASDIRDALERMDLSHVEY